MDVVEVRFCDGVFSSPFLLVFFGVILFCISFDSFPFPVIFFRPESFVLRGVHLFVVLPVTVVLLLTFTDINDAVVSEVFFFPGDSFEEIASSLGLSPFAALSLLPLLDCPLVLVMLILLFLHRFLEVSHGLVPRRFIHEEIRGVDGIVECSTLTNEKISVAH